MKSETSREAALLLAAGQLACPAREAFLEAACQGESALRARLEALLADGADSQTGSPVTSRSHGEDDPSGTVKIATIKLEFADEPPDEAVGQTLGRYKLLEKIGEGGYGVVYVADQTEPVRRRVALKVIKLGMDTKQVVARFEAERQALAMMDHPNIARALDAGTTDQGRPFFVMELVRGIRITDYCDQANLSTKDRLDLFLKVCQAIQHAHQKGIIHRDIKPSNILVTLHDGVPVPKVIDFGIAKATEGRLTDNPVYTQLHQFIGTPAYMSPEQAEMSGLDIDTRSDIYSLGVLLYELLAGIPPFEATDLMAAGIDAMRKTIREKEPARPSNKLASLGNEELSTTAKRRSVGVPKLLHQIQGDLDWIVMKCLEKDRTRRYETANGLAADVTRHLTNEPVVARPPSTAYRFQKAFRRNRLGFAAAGAVALALVIGLSVAIYGWRETGSARDEAKAALGRIERDSHVANVQMADAFLEVGDAARASERLNASSRRFTNNWEWRYLSAAADQSLFVLRGHQDEVLSAVLSPDGQRVATGSKDGTVRFWILPSTESVWIANLGYEVRSVAFSPNGADIAAVGVGGLMVIIDSLNGKVKLSFQRDDYDMQRVAFSPDGSELLTASADHNAYIWDVSSGGLKSPPLIGHTGPLLSAAYNHDGSQIITTSDDGSARIWNKNTSSNILTVKTRAWVGAGQFDMVGEYFVTAGHDDGRATVWNTSNGKMRVNFAHDVRVSSACFIPNTKYVVTTAFDPVVRIWTPLFPDRPISKLIGHRGEIRQVACNSDGTRIVTASADRTARIWDPNADTQSLTGHQWEVVGGSFGSDNRRIITASHDGTARVWDSISGLELLKLEHDSFVFSAVFSPDNRSILTASHDSTVRVWDSETGDLLKTFAHPSPVSSAEYNSDGTRIVTSCNDGMVRIWEQSSSRLVREIQHVNSPPSSDSTDYILSRPRWPPLPASSAKYSPDGSLIIIASPHDSPWILKASSGELIVKLEGHFGGQRSAEFSPDNNRILTVSFDGAARIWDIKSHSNFILGRGAEEMVVSASFSPDNRLVITSSTDRRARIWDLDANMPIITLSGHSLDVLSAKFSPDGSSIVTTSMDRSCNVWFDKSFKERCQEFQNTVNYAEIEMLKKIFVNQLNSGKKIQNIRRELFDLNRGSTTAYFSISAAATEAQKQNSRELVYRVSRSDWLGVSSELKLRREQYGKNHWPWFLSLVVDGYLDAPTNRLEIAKSMLDRFEKDSDPEVAERVAKAVLFRAPPAGSELINRACVLADRAVKSDPTHAGLPYFQCIKALAEHRRGHWAAAVQFAEEMLKSAGAVPARDAQAGAVLAMARYRLGQSEAAREALAKAKDLLPESLLAEGKIPPELSDNWHDLLIAQVLIGEANGVLESK